MDIIDSFNKLTLGKYDEVKTISQDETLEDVDRMVGIISVLTDRPEEEILHLPIHEFTELSSKTAFLSGNDFQGGMVAKKYQVGRWELIPVTDYRKLETCQYIDFKTYAADPDNHLVELLSVILVPKGHRYNEGYDILEIQQSIRDGMTVTDGVTLVGFFLTLFKKLIVDSLHYSREEAERLPKGRKREKILERIKEQETLLGINGDGSDV